MKVTAAHRPTVDCTVQDGGRNRLRSWLSKREISHYELHGSICTPPERVRATIKYALATGRLDPQLESNPSQVQSS